MLSYARCQALRALWPTRSGIALRIAAGLLLMQTSTLPLRAQATNPDAAFLNDGSTPSSSASPAPVAVPEPSVQPEPVVSPEPAPTPGPTAPTDLTPPPAPRTESSPAKAPSDAVISRSEVRDVSVQKADIDSPFFTERQEAKSALAREGREGFGMYVPKPPHPPVGKQIRKFFGGMIGSFRSSSASSKPALVLTVEPSQFSLAQTSELEVTLRISNAAKHEMEIQYPDNQRLEILVKDPQGNVVSRWSQDRAFDPREGFVEVNPKEFISYTERLSTSGMKAGVPYTIEASLAHQDDYTVAKSVTPES